MSTSGKSSTAKGAASIQNQTKRTKLNVKKQAFASGLQPRGNTVDAKYTAS